LQIRYPNKNAWIHCFVSECPVPSIVDVVGREVFSLPDEFAPSVVDAQSLYGFYGAVVEDGEGGILFELAVGMDDIGIENIIFFDDREE